MVNVFKENPITGEKDLVGPMAYGEICVQDNSVETVIGSSGKNNKVQVTVFNTNGESNDMTPDHTNDHIIVDIAGIYEALINMHIKSVGAGGADTFGFSLYKNNGQTEFPNVHGHRRLAGGGGDVGSLSLSGIIALAIDDTIELWAWNEDSTDNIIVEDVTLSLKQIGG